MIIGFPVAGGEILSVSEAQTAAWRQFEEQHLLICAEDGITLRTQARTNQPDPSGGVSEPYRPDR